MRVSLDTLGCKLNQAESELLARQLAEAGHVLVAGAQDADVYILNTCTVTRQADSRSRQLLRRARRRNPCALLVAAGCYAQRAAAELSRLEGVGLVINREEQADLPRLLSELAPSMGTGETGSTCRPRAARTRAFVKVQAGCSCFCSYCIVPLVRGPETSLPASQVISEVRQRLAEGYQEVVLTGTRVGAYRHDGADLTTLLRRVLTETGVPRVRLSSLQPQEITPELLRLWADGRLCPHFHLSLQSGSDGVLARMRRRYSVDDYERAVSLIGGSIPDVAITTDVIVGFPGESEEEFAESYDFCRRMGFARIHVFPYSPRSGTEAARLAQQVDTERKRKRTERMLALAAESADSFRRRFSGRTLPVLWERRTADGRWSGLSGNYIRVHTESDEYLVNRVTMARVE